MNPFPSTRTLVALGCAGWLFILGCRVADVVAQAGPAPTRAVTRTAPRPTFTAAPPTSPPTDVPAPSSTPPPAVPTRTPAPRIPTRKPPTLAPPPTPVPPPTADPYQGYFYRVARNTCVSSGPNTIIQGTVSERGVKVDGITVRVSAVPGGPPAINDFVTGVDPFDFKHKDPSLQGQYRLGIAEGGYASGNWFVFVINTQGDQMSPNASVHTDDKAGCNIATVDFAFQ